MSRDDVRFLWDERKRLANLDAHGLDFADVRDFVWDESVVVPVRASSSGRARFKAIGRLGRRWVVVIFSPMGTEAISIISMRPANARERPAHE